jgi:hypothetical protein
LRPNIRLEEITKLVLRLKELNRILDCSELKSPKSENQGRSKENMRTFYSLFAYYHKTPKQLMYILRELDKFDSYPSLTAVHVLGTSLKSKQKEVAPNKVYLKKISNQQIECSLSDAVGKLSVANLSPDNCIFF